MNACRRFDLARAGLLLAASVGCSRQNEPPPPKTDAASPNAAAPLDAEDPTPTDPSAPLAPAEPLEACTAPCAPRIIAEGKSPARVTLDATRVFWIDEGELRSAPRVGGASVVLASEVLGEDLELDDDAVVMCRQRADRDRDVLRVTKDGKTTTTLATAGTCRLAVSETHLYFADGPASWKKTLARVPNKAGGTPEPIGPESLQLAGIVVDGAQVFWTSDDRIQRFDETTKKVDVVATDEGEIEDLAVTTTHVYWVRGADLWRAPREGGGKPERIANHQEPLDIASDGTRVYWTSNAEERWTRYDPGKGELQVRALDGKPRAIAVEGSEVLVTISGARGRLEALETCACSPTVLEPRPPIRIADGPEAEQAIRSGSADATGRIQVQIRDLSPDETHDVDALVASGAPVSLDDERVPQRFRKGAKFRVTTSGGVFDAELVGADAGTGGEGNQFYIFLQGPPAIAERTGLITRIDGPKIGPLRSVTADPDAARKVLAAVRKASDAAGHGRRVGRNHVTAVRGNFPAPHVYAVTVVFPIPGASEHEDSGIISAFWFTDAAGNVTHELLPIEDRSETFELYWLVDVGEDGTDEIVWNSHYHEGDYDLLVTWDGSTPSYETLSGDGS